MPYADPVKRQEYVNEYKRKKRAERGLQKSGRKSNTPEQVVASKIHRAQWDAEYTRNKRRLLPARRLLYSANSRAKKRELDCTITIEDIEIPEVCPYLKIPLQSYSPRGAPRLQVMSLDRIDPTKGYIPGNVEVISWLANTMKNNATPEQLVAFAKEVLKRYDN